MITTVFFDLDDTLFDHRHSRRCGFRALREMHPALAAVDIRRMERFHEELIWSNFTRVLNGEISVHDAMTDRIRALCSHFGCPLDPADVPETVRHYDTAYQKSRRAVPGCRKLLASLAGNVQVGIITNGFTALQEEKIALLNITPFIDLLVISEQAGFQKPDRRIFAAALEKAGSLPAEAIYVGDSWQVDIVPATSHGMRGVWLNRYGHPCPDPSRARMITSYVGMDIGELLG